MFVPKYKPALSVVTIAWKKDDILFLSCPVATLFPENEEIEEKRN